MNYSEKLINKQTNKRSKLQSIYHIYLSSQTFFIQGWVSLNRKMWAFPNTPFQFTCDDGLDPACPLLDRLSFPSLFFLPLDTLADSLSPRGALSAGTKYSNKMHWKKTLLLLIAWVACARYQVRRNNYTRRQNGLKPKNAEIPSTSSLSRLLIKATKSQALLDKGQLSRKTWAWIIYLCIWNKSKRNKPYVLLLCGNAANCLWYAYGEKKWIGTTASDQKMGVEFV